MINNSKGDVRGIKLWREWGFMGRCPKALSFKDHEGRKGRTWNWRSSRALESCRDSTEHRPKKAHSCLVLFLHTIVYQHWLSVISALPITEQKTLPQVWAWVFGAQCFLTLRIEPMCIAFISASCVYGLLSLWCGPLELCFPEWSQCLYLINAQLSFVAFLRFPVSS